jgi:hypothetical protein
MSAIDVFSAAWPSNYRPSSPNSFDTFDVSRLSATSWPDILQGDISASLTGWGDGEMLESATDRFERPATTEVHSFAGSKPRKRGRPRLSPRENDDKTVLDHLTLSFAPMLMGTYSGDVPRFA